ncbi:MAG: hypothetical protein E6H92_08660 [Chloroflexi bacterium]|nr:MAG: hypothetical protein E6H92_08660 [Chloroflexota bacterium]
MPSVRGPVLATIAVGDRPGTAAVGAGAVWVPNTGAGTVSRIDPSTNRVVQTVRVGDAHDFYTRVCEPYGSVHSFMGTTFNIRRCDLPSAVAPGQGTVWITRNDQQSVVGVDPNGRQIASIPLGVTPLYLVVTDRALWMTSYQTDAIVRADPASGRVVSVIREPGQGPSGIAVGEGAIWVANSRAGTVVRIDPADNQVIATVPIECVRVCEIGPVPLAVATGFGAVWVRNEGNGTLSRIDPKTNRVVATLDIDAFYGRDGLDAIAVTPSALFLSGLSLQRVDPITNRVTRLSSETAITLAYGMGSLWLTDITGRILRIDPGQLH